MLGEAAKIADPEHDDEHAADPVQNASAFSSG
jgi:hypothetical protein